jgi:membrane-bound serine protease (ClpP class)
LTCKPCRPVYALLFCLLGTGLSTSAPWAETAPRVVEVRLNMMIHHVSAEYVVRGIQYANQTNAAAVLLRLNTPGGLQNSMFAITEAILNSRVPVITYVAPSGASAASAGFFVLLAGDVAVMAPGTNSGAAHPVLIFGTEVSKTMETKLENDFAAYIRSIAQKRGRNQQKAEDAVRNSASYTDQEALDLKLIDAVASTPNDIFAKFDGKTIKRIDGSTTTLHLANAVVEPFVMPRLEMFFAWIADPNIALLFGALGLACLYIEFTHPGVIVPGIVGALALVLALYAFNLLPINYMGVLLIALALGLFVLEVKLTSHGALAAAGIIALVIGAMILVNSPWPEARIHLSTALGVAIPLGGITVVLLRLAVAARRRKSVTGEAGMINSIAVAETDFDRTGKVLIRGEIWTARAPGKVQKGTPLRVKAVDGLTLVVEPAPDTRE